MRERYIVFLPSSLVSGEVPDTGGPVEASGLRLPILTLWILERIVPKLGKLKSTALEDMDGFGPTEREQLNSRSLGVKCGNK